MPKKLLAALAISFAALSAVCATFTGDVSNDWGESGNWDPAGVPSSGSVTIPDGKTVVVGDSQIANVNGVTTLTLDGEGATVVFESATPFTCTLAGNGEVMKTSSSLWTLSKAQTGFTGAFTIAAGTIKLGEPGCCTALGKNDSTSRPLTVTNNAALDVYCTTAEKTTLRFNLREVRLAGAGPDGNGALRNSGSAIAYYLFRRLTLLGDTRIACQKRFTTLSSSDFILNMNGYTLTQSPTGEDIFYTGSVTNAGRHIVQGKSGATAGLRLGKDFSYLGDLGDPPLEVGSYATFSCYGMKKQMRPLKFSGTTSCYIYTNSERGWNTNYNNFAGPIEVADGVTANFPFQAKTDYKQMFTMSGPLSGGGTIKVSNWGKVAFGCPTNASPAFTGNITLDGTNGASLVAFYPASIPDYSHLHVARSRVTVPMDTWGRADIMNLANQATLTGGAVVDINTENLEGQTASLTLDDSDIVSSKFGIGHDGPGTLNLSGPFTKPVHIGAHDGTLKLTGSGQITIAGGTIGGDGSSCSGTLVVDNASDVVLKQGGELEIGGLYPYNDNAGNLFQRPKAVFSNCKFVQESDYPGLVKSGHLRVGYRSPGLVEFGPGTSFEGRIMSGYVANSGYALIRQTGGDVWLFGKAYEDNSTYNSSTIGYVGYSCWNITGGKLTLEGYIAFAHYGANCQGVIEQTGGEVVHKLHRNPLGGSTSSHWILGNLSNAQGAYYLRGGTLVDEGRVFLGCTGQTKAVMTIEGPDASATMANAIRVAYRTNVVFAALCLVDGGSLQVPTVASTIDSTWKYATNNCLNIDGGVLRAPASSGETIFVAESIRRFFVYSRGATFDSNGRSDLHISTPILAPEGQGVVSATMPASLANTEFLGTPFLEVKGDGYGAVVAANWDASTRRVTGVRVVAPGSGYTTASLVVHYGVTNKTDSTAITLGAVSGGGIVKKGAGTLYLDKTNTYSGATILAGGTLKCGSDGAIPLGSTVVFAGGSLDMNGKKFTDGSSLPSSWAVDVDTVAASGTVVCSGNVEFTEGATLTVLNLESLAEDADMPRVLLRFDGNVVGTPTIVAADNPNWVVRWTGNRLSLSKNTGTMVIFR